MGNDPILSEALLATSLQSLEQVITGTISAVTGDQKPRAFMLVIFEDGKPHSKTHYRHNIAPESVFMAEQALVKVATTIYDEAHGMGALQPVS